MNNISQGTIIRTAVLAVALFNQILVSVGKHPLAVSDETIYQLITLLITVTSAGIAWWKNNSFTEQAKAADEYLQELKREGR